MFNQVKLLYFLLSIRLDDFWCVSCDCLFWFDSEMAMLIRHLATPVRAIAGPPTHE